MKDDVQIPCTYSCYVGADSIFKFPYFNLYSLHLYKKVAIHSPNSTTYTVKPGYNELWRSVYNEDFPQTNYKQFIIIIIIIIYLLKRISGYNQVCIYINTSIRDAW